MELPPEIPESLQAAALQLPELDEGEGAWSLADALAVIESLKGTVVPVEWVLLAGRVPWGYALGEEAWSCRRYDGEADTDYARRSRLGAAEFIERHQGEEAGLLFVLGFPLDDEAA